MRSSFKILIVDDHPLVRSGLQRLIEREPNLVVCGEAGSVEEAIRSLDSVRPDLAIIDISLPDGNGFDLMRRIQSRSSDTLFLVSSMHDETLLAERALRAGAMGYINKAEAAENVVYAIRQILDGKIWLSARMQERHDFNRPDEVSADIGKTPAECLSNRELEVFDLIGRGLGTSEIANMLHLSVKTIETHRANIKAKLNLGSGGELNRRAMQWSLEGK
jgi:DNA-binding NarL/FixJ family response regulator